ncbi:GNAT family N-acetyltransferase [Clostridium chromiireducens]|uniref:GNAT family N-acetyltransferase n=1 Tax=Clostridium chromiireducens TaxID=225345 RepID=UPI003AF926D1
MKDPYEICPNFETESFILRLVSEEDSEGLLRCYSDSKAQKNFNSDRCTGDFCIYAIEDMLQCIKAWLYAYSQQEFIRFAIIDKSLSKAIGTVEMFGYVGKYKIKTGILRVDVSSEYENIDYLNEIFNVCDENFFDLFEVDMIATKAIPQAVERRNTLIKNDFCEGKVSEGEHYYLRSK